MLYCAEAIKSFWNSSHPCGVCAVTLRVIIIHYYRITKMNFGFVGNKTTSWYNMVCSCALISVDWNSSKWPKPYSGAFPGHLAEASTLSSHFTHLAASLSHFLFLLQVSGQEESPRGQRILTSPLWPSSLGISQLCQYKDQTNGLTCLSLLLKCHYWGSVYFLFSEMRSVLFSR